MSTWPKFDIDGVAFFEMVAGDTATFALDWSEWLEEPGNSATIRTSSWDIPDGLGHEDDHHTSTDTNVTLSGGTARTNYDVANTITASNGIDATITETRTIRIKVVERIGR